MPTASSGSDLLLRKTGQVSRQISAPGRFQHGSIPGYTGHVQGRVAEDVHGVPHGKASALAAENVMRRSARPGHLQGYYPEHPKHGNTHCSTSSDFAVGRVDGGSFNTSICSADQGGRHASVSISGPAAPPMCRTVSTFHNSNGHGPRAGAAVPGYAGHVPGKYSGNVFAKRFAMSNVHATQVRQSNHETGAEWDTNWILHSENCKRQSAHGATSAGHRWQFSREPHDRTAPQGPGGWRLYEPAATHEWVRY